MTTADAAAVRYERRGATACITFDRPAARNAMTWAMYEQLGAALDAIDAEPDVRVAVLRGEGRTFVAGTDIAQFTAFTSGESGVAYERRLEAVVSRLGRLRVPTIAAVEGDAMGGGLLLAAACDLRLCTTDARFGAPIARTVGNTLSMANHARLVLLLGASRTMQLIATAEPMCADEALRCGFVLEVAPPAQLDARVESRCAQLASMAPLTLSATRQAIARIVDSVAAEGDDLVREVYGSRDFREGVAAFLARRPPSWEGR